MILTLKLKDLCCVYLVVEGSASGVLCPSHADVEDGGFGAGLLFYVAVDVRMGPDSCLDVSLCFSSTLRPTARKKKRALNVTSPSL
jgi:hypothetical protein